MWIWHIGRNTILTTVASIVKQPFFVIAPYVADGVIWFEVVKGDFHITHHSDLSLSGWRSYMV